MAHPISDKQALEEVLEAAGVLLRLNSRNGGAIVAHRLEPVFEALAQVVLLQDVDDAEKDDGVLVGRRRRLRLLPCAARHAPLTRCIN